MKQGLFFLLLLFCILNLQAADRPPKKIYLFYTNDLQGGIGEQKATFMNPNFPPVLGGGASAETIIKNFRKKARRNGDLVLLLDGGDIFYSSRPIGKKSKGLAIIDYMNAIGYNALVPGNHDFDFGKKAFGALVKQARFPVLAANLFNRQNNNPPDGVKPYVVIEKQGLRIGLFGIVSRSAEENKNPQAVAGLRFSDEVPAARKAVAALKKENVDLIIALAHLGLPYDAQKGYRYLQEADSLRLKKLSYVNAMELAHYVPGIDALVSGRIHRGYRQPWEDPVNHTICLQDYPNGGNLGLIILKISTASKALTGYELPSEDGSLLLLSEDEFWPDKCMANKINRLQQKYEPGFDKVIGVTVNSIYRSTRGESPMGDLMCDAMLEVSGADFAFNNFTGMRLDLQIGGITPRDVASVFPFGNEIVVVQMKGSLLKNLLEGSVRGNYAGLAIGGGKIIYKKDLPDGHKITRFEVHGRPLDPNKMYRVATTEYLADGNYGMTKLAFLPESQFKHTKVTVPQAVVGYIKEHSPLAIENDGRWIRQ